MTNVVAPCRMFLSELCGSSLTAGTQIESAERAEKQLSKTEVRAAVLHIPMDLRSMTSCPR